VSAAAAPAGARPGSLTGHADAGTGAAAVHVAAGAGGLVEGYASLFGRIDMGRDRVLAGAFRRSLARRGAAGVKMLWQHDPGRPIGRWTDIAEDGVGLRVKGRLIAEVAQGREALALVRAGVLDGLSIGFRTVRARRDPASGVRELVEIDLWEISLVTFPQMPGARLALARAAGRHGRLSLSSGLSHSTRGRA
jgi:HK97 family phage prohead protease